MHLQENTLFHTKCCSVPSTSCDLSCDLQHLKLLLRLIVYEEMHLQETWWTHRQTDGPTLIQINIPFFQQKKSGYNNHAQTCALVFRLFLLTDFLMTRIGS